MVHASASRTGQATRARSARWGSQGRIASTCVMPRRIAQGGDDAPCWAVASATRPLMGCHARCVLQRCTEPSARHNARTARAARMAFVRPTGLARASQASLATGVTPVRRACSEMIARWHAAGMTPATGTERATLPPAHAYAKRGSRDRTVRYATQAEEDGAWSVSKSAAGT